MAVQPKRQRYCSMANFIMLRVGAAKACAATYLGNVSRDVVGGWHVPGLSVTIRVVTHILHAMLQGLNKETQGMTSTMHNFSRQAAQQLPVDISQCYKYGIPCL